MTTFTAAIAILFAIGFIAWVSATLERHEQAHGGLSWFETLARRMPRGLQPDGDRDLARTLDDLRAAEQRDGSPRH